MPTSYTLGAHFEEFIQKQLETGRYTSASEVIRAALGLLEDQAKLHELKLRELRDAIQEGLDSGEPVDGEEARARSRERLLAKQLRRG